MTIREIARQCGVSRGTVDRVINGRGKVHPDTQAKILQVLQEVGYTKNIAARALTVRRTSPVIGVVLSSIGNPFFDEVIAGIRKAEADLTDYGVSVALEPMRGYDVAEQLARIEALEQAMSALVIQPINDGRIAEKVKRLAEAGVPTVTLNSDLEDSDRVCYVGSDYLKGGQTAAGLLALATCGAAQVGVLTGVPTILGHVQRLQGFESRLRDIAPDITILARESAQDDIDHAYAVTRRMLAAHAALDTLMVIAAGLPGVCRAVIDAGREQSLRVFAFDNIPSTGEMMRRGLVKAVISQQPFTQGYRAIRAAFDTVLAGKPETERFIMENQIRIWENLGD